MNYVITRKWQLITSIFTVPSIVTWSWETRKVYGIPPAGRGYHASLLYDSRLFMFGGYDGGTVFDDVYILDLSTCAYLPQITDFQVPFYFLSLNWAALLAVAEYLSGFIHA